MPKSVMPYPQNKQWGKMPPLIPWRWGGGGGGGEEVHYFMKYRLMHPYFLCTNFDVFVYMLAPVNCRDLRRVLRPKSRFPNEHSSPVTGTNQKLDL